MQSNVGHRGNPWISRPQYGQTGAASAAGPPRAAAGGWDASLRHGSGAARSTPMSPYSQSQPPRGRSRNRTDERPGGTPSQMPGNAHRFDPEAIVERIEDLNRQVSHLITIQSRASERLAQMEDVVASNATLITDVREKVNLNQ